MNSPLWDLTGFQRDLLSVVVNQGPMKGLAIKAALEDVGYPSINHGRLYPNLNLLAEKGLIDKDEKAIDDRTNSYEATRRGEREHRLDHEWRAGLHEEGDD